MVETYDVIVVGGGNAGLCAALAARERGATVVVLERAPRHMRGGNSRHTRNLRCAHGADNLGTVGAYPEEEFWEDLRSVSGPEMNETLARQLIRLSTDIPRWATAQGVRWQPALAGTLGLNRTNLFFLGGGKALLNAYYDRAVQLGIDVRYEAVVTNFLLDGDRFEGVVVQQGERCQTLRGRAGVVAAGGFEAGLPWLAEYWGAAAERFLVRGTPYNDGLVLRLLLAAGAQAVGDPSRFHGVAVDARAPRFDGGIATRVDGVPFGIVVNTAGLRIYDEGEELWPKRYAIWGRILAQQPGQLAYVVLDARTLCRFIPPMFPPITAPTLSDLARALDTQFGLDQTQFLATVDAYNRSAAHNTQIRPEILDGAGTHGLQPPKSNWALPLIHPPFAAFPLRPGITFTYMGVAVDEQARILRRGGRAFANLYAAGEIMAGNILTRGYLAGVGMTIGAVFGRLAGTEAAHV